MKKLLLAAVAGAATAFMAALPAYAETMRAVSFIPSNHPVLNQANAWIEKVNAEMGDALKINFIGGPEVIGRFQQVEAASTGVVDIIIVPSNDYQDRMPVSPSFVLSRLSPSEERKSGFYDFMAAQHAEKLNLRYLGRVQRSPFYLWTKPEPKSIADLSGLKMRTGVLYDKFMRELGMAPVTINSPEVYTALKSGVVDGFGWPVAGPRKRGWLEEVKHVVDIPFFSASNVVALMNLDKFNSLPEATRQKLIDITAAFEPTMVAYFEAEDAKEWKAIGDSVKRVTFSADENKKYLDTAYNAEWATLKKRAPEHYDELRKMTGN